MHGPSYFHAAGFNGLLCRNVLYRLAVDKSLVRDPLCKSHPTAANSRLVPSTVEVQVHNRLLAITGLMSASVLARLVHSTWHMMVVQTHAIYPP
jgi:hypothetical protein